MSPNPYQTPNVELQSDGAISSISAFGRSIGPAVISAALTIVFWITFALVLGQATLAVDKLKILIIWAMSLLVSMGTSTTLVACLWRVRSVPLAFGLVYGIFAIVFNILVSGPNPVEERWEALIVYGTLALLPVLASTIVYFIRATSDVMNRDLNRRRWF